MRLRTVVGLWLGLACVTWNVVFDRAVAVAALGFTREQIQRHQQGQPVSSIDEGFSPRVRAAAKTASAWTALPLALGAVAVTFGRRRTRRRRPE